MNAERKFRPEPIPRRGEWTAWTLTIITLAAGLFLRTQIGKMPLIAAIFIGILLLSALSISLSNWMDRNTVLTLKPEGVAFRNGLRDVLLGWAEIIAVQVFASQFGAKVHVMGPGSTFNFRTMSEVTYKGQARGQIGFVQGEFIIQQILKNSGLEETSSPDVSREGRYYVRP
jgi:hypothetical protein